MRRKRRRVLTEHSPRMRQAASALGVSRGHLWAVLTGRRESRRLRGRYREWLRSDGQVDHG